MSAYRAISAVAVAILFLSFGSLALAASNPQAAGSSQSPVRRAGVDPDRRRFEINRLARELNSQFDSSPQQQPEASPTTPSLQDLGLQENYLGHTYFYYPLHLRTFSYNPGQRRFYVNYRYPFGYRNYYYHPMFTPFRPFP